MIIRKDDIVRFKLDGRILEGKVLGPADVEELTHLWVVEHTNSRGTSYFYVDPVAVEVISR